MSESGNVAVTMAVDTKKYGIRIHKALFRQLGEPRYIFTKRCSVSSESRGIFNSL